MSDVAGGGELDGVTRADGRAGGAAHQAHLRLDNHRLISIIIKGIDTTPAGCDAHVASDAAFSDNGGMPLDIFTQNSVPLVIVS